MGILDAIERVLTFDKKTFSVEQSQQEVAQRICENWMQVGADMKAAVHTVKEAHIKEYEAVHGR